MGINPIVYLYLGHKISLLQLPISFTALPLDMIFIPRILRNLF
jgi:hypothetical protein